MLATSRAKAFIIGICLITLAVIVACGEEATPTPTGTPTATATPTATPTPTATLMAEVEPTGVLDVGTSELGAPTFTDYNQSFGQSKIEALITHENWWDTSPDGKTLPRLVKEWEVDPTGQVYTFHFQEGIPWNDPQGRDWGELTADDVIWTLEVIASEGSSHSSAGSIRSFFLCGERPRDEEAEPTPWQHGARPLEQEAVCELTKVDDYTVQLMSTNLTYQATWYNRSPEAGTPPHSKDHFEAVGEDRANLEAVGTGPWVMIEAKSGDFIRVGAVRDHWFSTPQWEEMIWWEIAEESTRLANFLTGVLDTGLFNKDSIQAIQNENNPEINYMRFPGALQQYLSLHGMQWYTDAPAHQPGPSGEEPDVRLADDVFDCTLPWVSCDRDPESEDWDRARKVRLAMNLAIDRQKMVNNLAFGEGEPAHIAYWSGQEAYFKQFGLDQLVYDYDPQRARQLLAEAGFPDGFEIDLALVPHGGGAVEAAQAAATMLEDVGISTVQTNIPSSVFRPFRVSRAASGLQSSNIGPAFPEPIYRYSRNYNSTNSFNYGFEHPLWEEMISDTFATLDEEERWAKEAEMARWVFDNSLVIPLFQENTVWPLGPEIGSWEPMQGTLDWLSNWESAPHRQ